MCCFNLFLKDFYQFFLNIMNYSMRRKMLQIGPCLNFLKFTITIESWVYDFNEKIPFLYFHLSLHQKLILRICSAMFVYIFLLVIIDFNFREVALKWSICWKYSNCRFELKNKNFVIIVLIIKNCRYSV